MYSQGSAAASTGTKQAPSNERSVKNSCLSILIVDDDLQVLDGLKTLLEDRGCKVDTATSPEEADLMLTGGTHQVIIVDVLFKAPSITGDAFVLDNLDLIQESKIIVISAYEPDTIAGYERLRQLGIPVLVKGSGYIDDLLDFLVGYEESLNANSPESKAEEKVLNLVRELLVGWLQSRQDRDKKGLLYGANLYSIDDIIEQIEVGSPVGQAYLEMMIEEIKDTFRIGNA